MAQAKQAVLLYCPRSLRAALPYLASSHNLLIETPAGFGKTEALRHYRKREVFAPAFSGQVSLKSGGLPWKSA
ncbi:MAG: hypothetical protein LBJ14_05350 [Desulfarculales bacterium]|jgi:ATP/maltotriose-dependent transcriptional regulator MalT|nr:hypothetical protein [Desulfarculales bacterium]